MHMPKRRALLAIIPALLLVGLIFALVSLWKPARAAAPPDGRLAITDPGLAKGMHSYAVGNFVVTLSATGQDAPGGYPGPRLYVTHRAAPGRWLWHTLRGQAFAAAAVGAEQVSESRGSYDIRDALSVTCTEQTIETVDQWQDAVEIGGSLACSDGRKVGYTLEFTAAGANQLAFHLTFDDPKFNRTYLNYASDSDEHFFGFGEQFSRFDHKGHLVPIWVSEQGIGRGQQPVTFLVDLAAGAGGGPYTTYAAVPHYITSRLRSLFLENSQYAAFDLRRPDRVQISVFAPNLRGRILYGADPEELVSEYTLWAGRMRPLPDWILAGAVVGMQGGTDRVREVYAGLKARGTPVSAFWLQDWVGQRETSFGKQLWWNWELDADRYPGWDELRADLAEDGVRLMVYVSPFLADVDGLKPNLRRDLFAEAAQAGYLVKNQAGEPYLIQNTDFSAGLLDLTNPRAVSWFKSVLAEQVVAAGASGWMADFGEALPYDAVLYGGIPAAEYHNRYPEEWARLNRDFIDTLDDGDQYVFFTRSGFSQSPGFTTLMWLGDQMVTWDAHDGIKSAVTGLLSGSISGFSLNHSDIGGYTGINNPLLKIRREKELLLRWMEFAAFTPIYRTHEGNTPDQNAQFYTDAETLDHFDRGARIYRAWEFLRKRLVRNASETGVPVIRPLFMHYPEDRVTYGLSYQQFMVGPDILVAPVLDPGRDTVRVYLPAGNWIHAWSGAAYRSPFVGQWVEVPAPLGEPGVFVKEGIPDGEQFLENLRAEGLIQ